jgi:ABC-type Fe3+/spermidine/putrescine transport system ATPase subunit
MAVIGASGSGKTTLLQQIIGLQQPDRGSIQVLGQSLDDLEVWRHACCGVAGACCSSRRRCSAR